MKLRALVVHGQPDDQLAASVPPYLTSPTNPLPHRPNPQFPGSARELRPGRLHAAHSCRTVGEAQEKAGANTKAPQVRLVAMIEQTGLLCTFDASGERQLKSSPPNIGVIDQSGK